MHLDSCRRNVEVVRDVLHGPALYHQRTDLLLAGREPQLGKLAQWTSGRGGGSRSGSSANSEHGRWHIDAICKNKSQRAL